MKKFIIFTEYGRKIGVIIAEEYGKNQTCTHFNFYINENDVTRVVATINLNYTIIEAIYYEN